LVLGLDLQVALDSLRFFAKPKLALDAVGGESATRMAEALEQGGQLVVYGCLSGKAPSWPWQAWVFKGLKVSVLSINYLCKNAYYVLGFHVLLYASAFKFKRWSFLT
jgi:hypothetical protein